jgi:hypothetical protein
MPREAIGELVQFVRYTASDDGIAIDETVARSEEQTGERNRALAHFMKSYGTIQHAPDLVLGTYFHACSIEMSCRQLAQAGRFLMLGGRHPEGGRVVSAKRARRILSLMLTCGHYDASGDFAFRVGIPGKSGVGGGILAVVPGKATIAVWSPGLNPSGNSQLGGLALERLADATGWSVFGGLLLPRFPSRRALPPGSKSLLNPATTGDELHNHDDHGDHQQDVDEAACDVEAEAQQPENDENGGDREQHGRAPSIRRVAGMREVERRPAPDRSGGGSALISIKYGSACPLPPLRLP